MADAWRADHHGAEQMSPGGLDLLPRIGGEETPWAEAYSRAVSGGFIEADLSAQAEAEADEWYRRPDSFNLWAYLFVRGTV